jgi:hypothetical protein
MLRMNRESGSSLAVLLVAGALSIAPAAANASPIGKLMHLHPRASQTQDSRVIVLIYNKGQLFQDVKVDGHVYTVMSHGWLTIKAPAGTEVYAASTGMGHHKGDLLFAVKPEMKNATISFN